MSYGKENGTGLGLAVVQKIVQDHGGEIHVERTPQGMTIFRIVLPGAMQAQDTVESADSLVHAQPDNATRISISHPSP